LLDSLLQETIDHFLKEDSATNIFPQKEEISVDGSSTPWTGK